MLGRGFRGRGRQPQRFEDPTLVNERIKSEQVRVIGPDGEQLGVITPARGMEIAKEHGLDLVEVAGNSKPTVCRIMDYGKFKFEKAKQVKAAKAKQHIVKIKEIKFHPSTDKNDYSYRLKHAKEFLEKGFKVKASMIFRGREMAHQDFGRKLLVQMTEDLTEFADVENASKMEGNNMHMLFAPKKATASK
jgi:translation initiation factor IF-3